MDVNSNKFTNNYISKFCNFVKINVKKFTNNYCFILQILFYALLTSFKFYQMYRNVVGSYLIV